MISWPAHLSLEQWLEQCSAPELEELLTAIAAALAAWDHAAANYALRARNTLHTVAATGSPRPIA